MTPARYATSGVSLQRVRELFSCHRDHFTPILPCSSIFLCRSSCSLGRLVLARGRAYDSSESA
jgi:hypothetical protein